MARPLWDGKLQIAEVTWTPDGWPVAAYGRRPRAVLNMPFSEEIPTLTPVGITRWKGEEWITQRALDTANFTVEKDALTLCGNGLDLCDRKMQGLLLGPPAGTRVHCGNSAGNPRCRYCRADLLLR